MTNHVGNIDHRALAEEVKAEFLHAWHGYKSFAWGHDDLKPLSRGFHDWHKVPLLMSALDGLDTMILMGLKEDADSTREYIARNLSFDHDMVVQSFEIAIRMLGSLVSCYQLTDDKRLLSLADDLAHRLLPTFDSPTGMPYRNVNLRTGEVSGSVSNPAEIGTLLVEFGSLSRLTDNRKLYDLPRRAMTALFDRKSRLGLFGTSIDVETGDWVNSESHIGGCIDSYYEYMLKGSILFDDKECESMWQNSIDAINTHLAHETQDGFWYGVVDMNSGRRIATNFGALAAFFPAVLALSGDLERADRFQESCFKSWTKFEVEPEVVDYTTWEVVSPAYPLRPETVESAYYLYHYTRDSKYLAMGKYIFGSLKRYCRSEVGYAGLSDVRSKAKADHMESFFLSETLKYLYLLFSDDLDWDPTTTVFNTEAHPIRKDW